MWYKTSGCRSSRVVAGPGPSDLGSSPLLHKSLPLGLQSKCCCWLELTDWMSAAVVATAAGRTPPQNTSLGALSNDILGQRRHAGSECHYFLKASARPALRPPHVQERILVYIPFVRDAPPRPRKQALTLQCYKIDATQRRATVKDTNERGCKAGIWQRTGLGCALSWTQEQIVGRSTALGVSRHSGPRYNSVHRPRV